MIPFLPLALLALLALTPGCTDRSAGPQPLRMADAAFSRGEYLESERLYESYLQAYPDHKERWRAWQRLLTISRSIRKSPARSILLLEAMHLEFIEDRARLWEVLQDLGREYMRQGELEKAAAALQKTLEIPGRVMEEYAETRFLLHECHKRSADYDTARAVLVDGLHLELEPELRARMLLEISNSSGYLGDLGYAQDRLEEILEMDLGESELRSLAIFSLADIAEQQGEYERASELFTSVQHRHPNPAAVKARLNNLDKTIARGQLLSK
jgi:tetratricopeptide (TPR) repeat protein